MLNPPVQPISIGFKLHWFPGVSRNCIYLPNGIFKKENAHQPSDLIGFVVFPNFFQTNPFVFQQSMPFVARIQVAERMQRAQRATSNGVSTTLMKWTAQELCWMFLFAAAGTFKTSPRSGSIKDLRSKFPPQAQHVFCLFRQPGFPRHNFGAFFGTQPRDMADMA